MSEITEEEEEEEEEVARFQAEVSKKSSALRTTNIMGLLRYIMKWWRRGESPGQPFSLRVVN